jgi:hypothetical protein
VQHPPGCPLDATAGAGPPDPPALPLPLPVPYPCWGIELACAATQNFFTVHRALLKRGDPGTTLAQGLTRDHMKKILVAGGAGYIGSHACKALAMAGDLPVTLDNLVQGHRDAVLPGRGETGRRT